MGASKIMKVIKGWRRISSQDSYINESTGQTLIVCKKEFSENYHVLVFAGAKTDNKDGRRLSPDFANEAKAQAYALNLMKKHPNGIV